MKSNFKSQVKSALLGSVFTLGLASGLAGAASAQTVNTGFVVDESGSMGGEHAFLSVLIDPLDTELGNAGFAQRGYALIGYGSSGIDPVAFDPARNGAAVFMNTADFKTAAGNLLLNGGTEDGYDGLDFFLNRGGYTFDPTIGSIAVLVTDEDRDTFNGAVDFNSVLTSLDTLNTALVAVVNLPIMDSASNQAILTDGQNAFVADGSGGFVKTAGFTFGSGAGTTKADYADLALDPQTPAGCVADLNVLRSTDPILQQSFAAALQECIVVAAQSTTNPSTPTTGGLNEVLAGGQWVLTTWAQRLAAANSELIFRNRNGDTMANTANFTSGGGRVAASDSFTKGGIRKLRDDRESGRGMLAGADGKDAFYMDTNGGAYGKLTGYVVASYTDADYDAIGGTVGFDLDAVHIVTGADLDVYGGNGNVEVGRIGIGIGYAEGEAELDDGSEVEADTRSVTAYGAFRFTGGMFLNANLYYAMTDYEFARVTGGGIAMGNPEGDEWGGSVQIGKDFAVSHGDSNLILTPNARILYINNDIDSYTETGPGAVFVADQDSDSWIGELGVEGTYVTSWDHGPLALHGLATYIRKLDDNSDTFSYGTTPNNLTTVSIPDGDDNLGRIGGGITAFLGGTRGQQLRLVYEHTFSDDVREHKVIGRFRMPLKAD